MSSQVTGSRFVVAAMRFRSLVFVVLVVLAYPAVAAAGPVANSSALYSTFGRVFPDPQGGFCATTGLGPCSPLAQGRVPALTFLGFGEFEHGLKFLNSRSAWRRYLEVLPLSTGTFPGNGRSPEFTPDPSYVSAGTPTTTLGRAKHELYVVRVTDENIPDADKQRYVVSLSIHGIERAGIEGGVRALEDLVTAATTNVDGRPRTGQPILRTKDLGVAVPTFGDVLRQTIIYFVFPNPDGWARGSVGDGGINFQRYNGNGVDLNRDFEDIGYSFRRYSSASEPESRALTTVLREIAERGGPFVAGDDLHGQLTADSFSYTLLPHGSHDFGKNARLLQAAKTINKVQSDVLSWSPLIAPGDQAQGCGELPGVGSACVRVPGQTFGTVYDTIQYTVTGAIGDFFDSSIGLNADGVDNEMSYSHLVPDIVFSDQIEQLHVDGNVGLIYAHLAELLGGRTFAFPARGRKGYVGNPRVVGVDSARPAFPAGTKPQADIERTITGTPDQIVAEFPVRQSAGTFNGGMRVTVTHVNVQGNAPTAVLATLRVQCQGCDEHPGIHADGDWVDVAQDFNQSPLYIQAGMVATVNHPQAVKGGSPVKWRVVVATPGVPVARLHVEFSSGPASGSGDTGGGEAPRKRAYNVASSDFWSALNGFAPRGNQYEEIDPARALPPLDTLVVSDVVPGAARFAARAKAFVEGGGNLVLTDGALRLLPALVPAIGADKVKSQLQYVGQVVFAKADVAGRDPSVAASTTKDPLAAGIDQPGARFNSGLKRQTYEPVPVGFKITDDAGGDFAAAPQWFVDRAAWEAAGGRVVGTGVAPGPSPAVASAPSIVTLGELPLGNGVVRIIGGLLPQPTEKYDHEAGLEPHGVTYSGYQLGMNLTGYCRADNARCGAALPSLASRDRLAPVSRFTRSQSRLRRRSLVLAGTSRDRAPRGFLAHVTRVDVALGRRVGSRCRFVGVDGRFGAARSCTRPTFVQPRGRASWTLRLRRTLAAGAYLARVRGADRFGNVERAPRALRFRLR
jgi:hypothetical protein